MSISHLTSAQLSHLVALIREKEKLIALAAKIDQELAAIESSSLRQHQVRPASAGVRRRKPRRGKMREAVLEALKIAGKRGASLKEIADATGANPASLSVWFYTSGKKVKGLRKVRRGIYAYKST